MKHLAAAVMLGAAVALTGGARSAAAQEPDGSALYQQNCKKCHGATGTPSARIAGMYPEIKPFSEMTGVSVDSMVVLMTNGAGDMKPLKDKLTPAEMKVVAQYVLTLAKPKAS